MMQHACSGCCQLTCNVHALMLLQMMQLVWSAWRSFVPEAQDKRHAKGRAAEHRQRRALILSLAWWHDYATTMKARKQQLADALLRWDTRRMWLVLEGWRTVAKYKQRRQEQLAQVCHPTACRPFHTASC